MSTTVSRSSPAVQSVSTADCRHSKQPFAAAFYVVNERRDISPAAKLVHAHLVTLHRTGRDATQTEIGDALGMSRHQVWRAIGELVTADLVQTIRIGLGRPNQYVLIGLGADDLSGRATGRRTGRRVLAGQSGARARVPSGPKEETKEQRFTGLEKRGYTDRRCRRCSGHRAHCDQCSACLPGPHALEVCYQY